MKRKDLITQMEEMGCVFIRHGGNHDWYQNPRTKVAHTIPRHNEINENLSKHIMKMLKNDAY